MRTLLPLLQAWCRAFGPWNGLLTLAAVLLLVLAAPALVAQRTPTFDGAFLRWFHGQVPPVLGEGLLRVYQLSGVHVSAVLVLAVLIFLGLKRYWTDLVCLVVATGGILLIVDSWLKPVFDRDRPNHRLLTDIDGRSFPSGHSAGALVFYFTTSYLLAAHYPRLRLPLFLGSSVWVLLVWASALYCRAHWLTDIAAGASIGYLWLAACLAGLRVWEQRQRPVPPA